MTRVFNQKAGDGLGEDPVRQRVGMGVGRGDLRVAEPAGQHRVQGQEQEAMVRRQPADGRMQVAEEIALHLLQLGVDHQQNGEAWLGQVAYLGERLDQGIPVLGLGVGFEEEALVATLDELQAVLGVLGVGVGMGLLQEQAVFQRQVGLGMVQQAVDKGVACGRECVIAPVGHQRRPLPAPGRRCRSGCSR
ncbi:MAG: hypothetical protein MZV64_28830 [Ignavibacteriales bacterium]|nr:hypothetical protein [Ignavibacteriales bacterium]